MKRQRTLTVDYSKSHVKRTFEAAIKEALLGPNEIAEFRWEDDGTVTVEVLLEENESPHG